MVHYKFCNTINMRDLGGYAVNSGGYTVNNLFIRSDLPKSITDDEKLFFINKNIKTIIDLRSNDAFEQKPNCFKNLSEFNVVNVPLNNGDKLLKNDDEYVNVLFDMIKDEKSIYKIFNIFAEYDGGILFHCAEGKDRTGVISALLLDLVDVCVEDILVDYSVSSTYFWKYSTVIRTNESLLAAQLGYSDGRVPEFYKYTKPDYIEKFFALFKDLYGSTGEYMKSIGITENQINKIKSTFTSQTISGLE